MSQRSYYLVLPVFVASVLAAASPTQQTIDSQTLQGWASELPGARLIESQRLSAAYRESLSKLGNDTGFMIEGDFKGDGGSELALVGTFKSPNARSNQRSATTKSPYPTSDANQKSFLLIGNRNGNGFERSALMTFEEDFVVLKKYPTKLAIFFCLGCDAGGFVEWDGSEYSFKPFEPYP